ncbi:MAG: alkaline phosphatase family protein [Bryobacterales bacterium]|nr:alkaline phosphatase family protein [Bryobacterales bacterium]
MLRQPAGKVFVMGIGSVRLPVMERLARQGRMPAFARLMKEGFAGSGVAQCVSEQEHTPWVSAATGAPAGTHRIISMMASENGR